jgi:hypothetical protein
MKMCWESISQLTRISCQIHILLLQLLNHHQPRALVSTILSSRQNSSLIVTRSNGPHQEARYAVCDSLGEAGEFGRVTSDDACIAVGFQWQDFKFGNDLWKWL